MKHLSNFINEAKQPKYVIKFYIEGVGNDIRYSDNWEHDVNSEPISKALYWEVLDSSKWNFSEPDPCIAWHGKDSFWGLAIKNSENPESAPKYATILKGKDLERIKKIEK